MSYYNQNQPPVGVPPQQGPRILQFIQIVYLVFHFFFLFWIWEPF